MAKLPDGIFGGFRGKIGNVVGVKRGDTFYIKSAPTTMKNPRTKKQQANRNRFGLASSMAARLNPFINVSFRNVKEKTRRGAFISYNMKSAIQQSDEGPVINYPELILSTGILKQVESPIAELKRDSDAEKIHLTWSDNSGEGNARGTDRVLILTITNRAKIAAYSIHDFVRADEFAELALPASMKGKEIYLYLAILSKNGDMGAHSVFVPIGE
ncbi:DUF6266 family protein [Rhodohalobacter halophilus]|uniref:DUF6266 family protein n=1 Tax=Rhodohalobacter halophilus TaxID=1812810 RepID=UPI00083FB8C3|nr:DUF6266 family protein [Rhodohalobacter halophilus]